MPSTAAEAVARAREEQADRAHRLQVEGGAWGALRWTIYSSFVVGVAHTYWPVFRRQTLAIKGFLISSAGIFGMVIGADSYLFKYEHAIRLQENEIRRHARNGLASEGRVATENEIQEWRAVHEDRVRREIAQREEARRAEG